MRQTTEGMLLMTLQVRQAVIMVGGKGTRLRPLTNNCPKPILPILDKPCTEYFIDSLSEAGMEEVIMACGYRSQQVRDALGDGSKQGIKVTYSYEDHPLGTGGALKLIQDKLDDVFIAINGDNFMDIDFRQMVKEHFASKAAVTISLSTTDNPCEVGIVRLDETGKVLEFKEKPKPEEVFSNILNTGVYVVNRDVLDFAPEDTMYDFSKELIPLLMEKGYRIQGYKDPGHWMDIGRPKDFLGANLLTAEKKFKGHDWSSQTKDSKVSGTSYLGKGTKVKDSVIDSAVVSEGCKVDDSKITHSLILSGCVIDDCVIENTILGKDCEIKDCKLKDCVLADGTVLHDKELENERGA